jgi:predicted DNA binding CopG/RHH family protein
MKIRSKTDEERNTTVNIRVSEKEKAQLKSLASALGLSVGAYLIGLALGESIGNAILDKPDERQMRLDV